jgi:hypothetical protein
VTASTPERPISRHIIVGISDPSNDPTRHRVFEIHAFIGETDEGWIAEVAEQNQNAQPEAWRPSLTDDGRVRSFPTAAACLGHAVEAIVTMVARDAAD